MKSKKNISKVIKARMLQQYGKKFPRYAEFVKKAQADYKKTAEKLGIKTNGLSQEKAKKAIDEFRFIDEIKSECTFYKVALYDDNKQLRNQDEIIEELRVSSLIHHYESIAKQYKVSLTNKNKTYKNADQVRAEITEAIQAEAKKKKTDKNG